MSNKPMPKHEIEAYTIKRLNALYDEGEIDIEKEKIPSPYEADWYDDNYMKYLTTEFFFSYVEYGMNCRDITEEEFTPIYGGWKYLKEIEIRRDI